MVRVPVAERRSLLRDAAWRVLLAEGVAGATTRAICAEAGMPQGAFHYCFESRDALLTELASVMLPRESMAASATVTRGGTLADALHRALLAYWELVESEPRTHQVIHEITALSLREPALVGPTRDRYRRYPQVVTSVLEEIAEVRRISWDRPLDVLARQVVALLDGLTLQFLIDRDAQAARGALAGFAEDLAGHAHRLRRGVPVSVGDGGVR